MRKININQLAKQMHARKEQGEKPYVLFLGAGISISSGVSGMNEMINRFLVDSGIVSNETIDELDRDKRFERFVGEMKNLNEIDRYSWLKAGFEDRKPSVGYSILTRLIEEDYFEVILTTNWDSFLNESLEKSNKLKNQKDFRIYVRGVDQDDFITRNFQRFSVPKIKLLKLHGELASRVIQVTPKETERFPKKIEDLLKDLFSHRDLMMIGYSVSDVDVKKCINPKQNSLIYINPYPPRDTSFRVVTRKFKHAQQIIGPDAEFDVFMSKLYDALSNHPGAILKKDFSRRGDLPLELLMKINTNIQQVLENSVWLVDHAKQNCQQN